MCRFKDEVMGLGYNCMPPVLWDKFQRQRPAGYQHEKPSLVHWEYGKEDDLDEQGNKVKGYWTAEDMVKLCGGLESITACLRTVYVLLVRVRLVRT